MKHAGPGTLSQLEPLLQQLRQINDLTERRPGVFYRKREAVLHFHEDPTGTFADVKVNGTFMRFPALSEPDRANILHLAIGD